MRHRAMLSIAIACMFILASAGVSRANWYHKSDSSGGNTSEMSSPSSESGMEAPQGESYEGQEATEAGGLPSDRNATESGTGIRSGDVPTVEVDGTVYRLGIDDGP